MKSKICLYKWPITILVVSIILSIGISFLPDCILAEEQRITIALSFLAIGFAIFQFYIVEINTEKRRKYDLRFIAIKEFIENSILLISSIDKYRAVKDIDIDEIYSEINSRINNLNTSLGNNISILFPEVIDKIQFKNFLDIDFIFSQITIQFRNEYIKDGDKDASINNELMKIAWNNGIYDNLLKFEKAKSELYELLKKYL